ncbi:MAG: flagellar hook capping protein [Tistrella sp.]|uniref:Basal-body rod modification protein FlgD n=1 Tax=Tistrella mobilis TaxID=171437 RepID=A0A3B9IP39_9PROT|nr:flagellar hook capping FlgD N-terminal domain-containing protein [Tistrella sp.]MAD40132.1 flagellar hook capping protein [Tistrella sp.]MBA77319.1 flagellar hook capping protein [Tistrella sp.]HAE49073.1 flagellar hook capping protein [Tistrella mobilis]
MATSSVTNTTATTATTSKATIANNKLADDFDQFLTLLTTQLKNQDPTNPLDTNEFTNQLVLFTQTEQLVQSNSNLESLISLSEGQQVANAASYIGKVVDANGDTIQMTDGSASYHYRLPENAEKVTVNIIDESGKVVRSEAGETTAGVHNYEWDGKDSEGKLLDDGQYRMSVTALDAKGKTIAVTTSITGTVDSVGITNGNVVLNVNGVEIPLSEVTGIRDASAATSEADATLKALQQLYNSGLIDQSTLLAAQEAAAA